jgi:hypothetical protein
VEKVQQKENAMADEQGIKHDWEYSLAGGWKKIISPMPPWTPDEGDFSDVLKRIGFGGEAHNLELDYYFGNMVIHMAHGDASEKYQYLVDLETGRPDEYLVFVPDFPSLCRLVQEVSPIVTLFMQKDWLERLEDITGKAFRAWHGHDVDGACRNCDPLAYEERRQKRQALAQKRAERELSREQGADKKA